MNALKVVSMRLRGTTSKELESLGEDTEGVIEATSKLQEKILELTNNRVNIMLDSDTYKSTYQIMKEISEVYQDLTDTQQAGLLETIAGKSRSNDVASLLSNWKQAEKAMIDATNAEGSARKENDIYMEHLQSKINVLKASIQELSGTVLSSDALAGLLDTANNFVNVLEFIVEKLGTIPTLLLAINTAMAFKSGGNLYIEFYEMLKSLPTSLGNLKSSLSQINSLLKNPNIGFTGVSAISKDSKAIKEYYSLLSKGVSESVASNQALVGTSAKVNKTLLSGCSDLTQAQTELAKAYGITEKQMLACETAGVATSIAISAGISVAIAGLSKMYETFRGWYFDRAARDMEAYEKALGSYEKTKANSDTLDELITKYKQVASAEYLSGDAKSQALEIQQQIVDLVGAEASGYNIVNGTLQERLNILDQIQAKQLEIEYNEARKTLETSRKAEDSYVVGEEYSFWNDLQGKATGVNTVYNVGSLFTDTNLINNLKENDALNYLETKNGTLNTYDNKLKIQGTTNQKINQLNTYIKAFEDAIEDTNDKFKQEEYQDAIDSFENIIIELEDLQYKTKQDALNYVSTSLETVISKSDILKNVELNNSNDYIEYRQQLLDVLRRDSEVQASLKHGDIRWNDLYNIVDTYMQSQDKFNRAYTDWAIHNSDESINQIEAIKDKFLDNTQKNNYKIVKKEYDAIAKRYKAIGGDPTRTKYGNIDLNDRHSIIWHTENISKYQKELASWGLKPDDVRDSLSTVLGGSINFDGVDIAFSPMLQTEDGAKLLSSETLETYLLSLINKASIDGSWTNEELIKLDTKGLEVDGIKIKNIIADIGDTALLTSQIMHYMGEEGILSLYSDKNTFFDISEEFNSWLDTLDKENLDYIYKISLDTKSASWDLEEWKRQLEYVQNGKYQNETSIKDFYNVFADTSDESFSATLEAYQTQLSTFQDMITKYKSGELSDSDINDLIRQYPKLINYTDDLDKGVNKLIDSSKSSIIEKFNEQIEVLGKDSDGGKMMAQLRDRIIEVTDAAKDGVVLNIDAETTFLENIGKALNESVSGSGISSSTVKSITNMFKNIKGFDASELFEKTSNGIHLNINALQDLQDEYIKTKKADLQDQLDEKINKYNKLTKQINKTTDMMKRANLVSEQNTLRKEIDEVATLITEYDGLTSAYNNWLRAKETDNEGKIYDTIRSGIEETKELYKNNLIGTDDFQEYVKMVSNQDLTNATAGEYATAWNNVKSKVERYSSDNATGVTNFLKDVQAIDKSIANINKNGDWEINFDDNTISMLADKLGISEQYIESIILKSQDFGMDLDLSGITEDLSIVDSYLSSCNKKLINLGLTKVEFDFSDTNLETLDGQIEKALELYNSAEFKDKNGNFNIKVEGAEEAKEILNNLILQRQQLANSNLGVMRIDTSKLSTGNTDEGQLNETLVYLKQIKIYYDEIQRLKTLDPKVDTSKLETEIELLTAGLTGIKPEILAKVGLDADSFSTEDIISKIQQLTPDALVKIGVNPEVIENYQPEDKTATVNTEVDSSEVDKYKAPNKEANIIYDVDTFASNYNAHRYNAPNIKGKIIYSPSSSSSSSSSSSNIPSINDITGGRDGNKATPFVDGTAHTNGIAYAQGSWGTKSSGIALGGELGQELVVYFMPPYMVTYK